jgi:archaeosine-15-forming tRNA-guanine transglycosylase
MLITKWQNSKLSAIFDYIFVIKKANENNNQQFCSRNAQTGCNQQVLRVIQRTQEKQTVRHSERSYRTRYQKQGTTFLRDIRECPSFRLIIGSEEETANNKREQD